MSDEHSPLKQFLSDLWNKAFRKSPCVYGQARLSSDEYLHFGRSLLPWDENWKLDQKFFRDMEAWREQHPDSTLLKIMEKVNDAVTKNMPFAELVPDTPFPARGLVKALAHVLALGVVRLFLLLVHRYYHLCEDNSKSEERRIRIYHGGDNLAFNG